MKRRLSVLALMVGCLVALGAKPSEPPTSYGRFCQRVMNDETCVWVCCDDIACDEYPC